MATVPDGAQAYPAPAKLNLDLRITGQRADGYHELESIFCLIDLCDTVYIAPRNDGKIILHTALDGVPQKSNLACRAAAALQPYSDGRTGADIWLEKRIPAGGGLGGGSSDAATVLMVLNKLWHCNLPRQALAEIGVKLGADVPFFIFGQSAFAKGIGEQLSELPVPLQWYVVVKPPVHVSTAAIFSHPRLTRNSEPSIMPSFQSLQPFRNDMQAVVFEEYPEVFAAYRRLEKIGKPLMTGSGACLFAAFEEEKRARSVFGEISRYYEAYYVRGLEYHPLQV